ncbi:MAG: SRPBCC family protein [Cyanobacteria bacterium P01_A01_bin.3]
MTERQFTQSVDIAAPVDVVDRCIVSEDTMALWLNPMLRCEAIGNWSTEVGSRFQFTLKIPLLAPHLDCVVQERRSGLVVWSFQGFFTGTDRWECRKNTSGTQLLNQFTFEIPTPLVRVGFDLVAARLTQRDMQAQLVRIKSIAEELHRKR